MNEQTGLKKPTHALYIVDNWDGEGDKYWIFAYKENGQWIDDETQKPVICVVGDEILKVVKLEESKPKLSKRSRRVLSVINSLRETDRAIETIFMHGSCYRFHLFLAETFPRSKPLISTEKDHIITEIDGHFYDITGEVSPEGFTEIKPDEMEMVESWSFSRTRLLSLKDCESCGEPILTGF